MINSAVHEKLSEVIMNLDSVNVSSEDDVPDLETALDALASAIAEVGLTEEVLDVDGAVDALVTKHELASDARGALVDIHGFVKELKYIGGGAGAAYELSRSKDALCSLLSRWATTHFGKPDDHTELNFN